METKHSFVRYVFGDIGSRFLQEIKYAIQNKFQVPYIVYIFGEENEKILKDLGLKTFLVDKRSHPWRDLNISRSHQLFRPKLEIVKVVLQDYDAAVFIDWDCIQVRNIPEDIWKRMELKGEIQACMQNTRRRLCYWRREHSRSYLNGGFLYLRNKELPQKFIDFWDAHPNIHERGNDEVALSGALDYYYFPLKHGVKPGHSISQIDWWNNYETDFCLIPYEYRNTYEEKRLLHRKIANRGGMIFNEVIETTNIFFLHFMKAKEIENYYRVYNLIV